MVTSSGITWLLASLTLAQQPVEPVLERLDPPRRAAVVMALLALVLTGLLLVTIAMLGANWVRRMARHKPGDLRSGQSARDAANHRRLRDSIQEILPNARTSDTIQLDDSGKETRIDS